MGQLLDRVRASIEEAQRSNAEAETIEDRGECCPDCGIDLPSTWHWDGCPNDRRATRVPTLRDLLGM